MNQFHWSSQSPGLRAAALLVGGLLLAAGEAVAGQITLAWDPSPGVVSGYVVHYGSAPGAYTSQIDVGGQTSSTIQGLTNGVRYYFVVKAYSASGVFSAPSNEVSGLVGSVISFTDDPLLPGVHTMKAVHLTELRSRIDALRSARGQTTWPWTLLTAGTVIRVSHIEELRSALNEVYVARGLSISTYLDGLVFGAGTYIRAIHITQLRAAVTALE